MNIVITHYPPAYIRISNILYTIFCSPSTLTHNDRAYLGEAAKKVIFLVSRPQKP